MTLDEAEAYVTETTAEIADRWGQAVVDDIREVIDESYPPPSIPGSPPHRRTGYLKDQVGYSVVTDGALTIVTIRSDAPYSFFLEEGTSRMAERPFFFENVQHWEPTLVQWLSAEFSISGAVSAAYGSIPFAV